MFDRYVAREIALHCAAVLCVVLAIYLTRRLGALLAEALDGTITPRLVFRLLWLRTLVALPGLFPVTLCLGVLLGVGRLYQDGEVVALASCGVREDRVLRSALVTALVFCGLIAVASLWGRPAAAERFQAARSEAGGSLRIGGLAPERFYVLGRERGPVVFAEGRAQDFLNDVFVQGRKPDGRVSLLLARRAADRVDAEAGSRTLLLSDGWRYELDPEAGIYEITRYEELTLRLPLAEEERDVSRRTRSTLDLRSSPRRPDRAELQWRLAAPVSALCLTVAALGLARMAPSRNRYARAVVALALYVVYRNLLGLAKEWVEAGTLSPWPGLWAVHGGFLCAAVLVWFAAARRGVMRPAGR